MEEIEKREDRRNLIFSYLCLVGRMEKWKVIKLICLVEKKKKMRGWESEIRINLQLYSY